jgi:membrane associated rhomboid family serine protease
MQRNTTSFGFPRFTGAVRTMILVSTAIYIAIVLLWAVRQPWASTVLAVGGLSPELVRRGWVWQLLTYGFVELDPRNFLFTMLGVFFLGSAVQERIGARAFLNLYFTSLIGAGLLACLLAWLGLGFGSAFGAGAAVNAILMVFYLFNRDAPIMLLFVPIPIPVKYIVIFTAAVEAVYLLLSHYALYFVVLLLGLVMGYVWHRFLWRRATVSGLVSKRVLDVRNAYYRWKRERAKKKFQVYMRKHENDPKQYFDEYGNFKPPGEKDKKDQGQGGWVN